LSVSVLPNIRAWI